MSVNEYLDAAVSIGNLLVRDAVWAGERCFWLMPSETDGDQGSRAVVACPLDFDNGAYGIGLFLGKLFVVHHDPLLAEVVNGVRRLLLLAPDCASATTAGKTGRASLQGPPAFPPVSGFAADPVAIINQKMNQHCADRPGSPAVDFEAWSPLQIADRAVECFQANLERFPCFADPSLGEALLDAAEQSGDLAWSAAAQVIANHVLCETVRFGQPWYSRVDQEYPLLGRSNGLAGIGSFLLRLSAAV